MDLMDKHLQQFVKTCSPASLGDLFMAKLNTASNTEKEFQEKVQQLLEHVLKMVEFAEKWAEAEAQSRYVTYIREHELLKREDQVLEAKRIIRRKRKLLRETVLEE
jgi:hypothetical protein